MSIKSKIQALITSANATTGESDTTLTDAVQTLVDGYGQGGGGGTVTATLVGETPVMSKSNNQNNANLCTFDVDGVSFDAILFISKDRAAFKLIPYFEDTIVAAQTGMMIYGNYIRNPQGSYTSFTIGARTDSSEKTITVCHSRMTGSAGGFYGSYPQKFDIYAVVLNPPSWVPGV